jgi:hypothetical protein
MRCRCANFTVAPSMFPGGPLHVVWFKETRLRHAHHPGCDKYDELQQLRLLEDYLERECFLVKNYRRKLEQKRLQTLIRRQGLKLV